MEEKVKLNFKFRDKKYHAIIFINNIEIHSIECDNMAQGKKLAVEYLFDLLGDIHDTIYNTPESTDTSGVIMNDEDIKDYNELNVGFHNNKVLIHHVFSDHFNVYENKIIYISEIMQYFCSMRYYMDQMERFLYSLVKEKKWNKHQK